MLGGKMMIQPISAQPLLLSRKFNAKHQQRFGSPTAKKLPVRRRYENNEKTMAGILFAIGALMLGALWYGAHPPQNKAQKAPVPPATQKLEKAPSVKPQ